MREFLAMGGYAFYVWASMAVFFVVLLLDALAPWLKRRRTLSEIRLQIKRQQQRRQAAQESAESAASENDA